MIDLSIYPKPDVIETLDYETILDRRVSRFKMLWATLRVKFPDLPEYDVEMLETDPVKIVLEAEAYEELLLRARVNQAALANLLFYATGADLDLLAAFYDVTRLDGENDEALRKRTFLAIKARSPGGSEHWYAAAAQRVSARIKSVSVYREEFWPIIHIAVLSADNNGIPDDELMEAVEKEVQGDRVRLMNDTIVVERATSSGTVIEANVWLLPNAQLDLIELLPEVLRNAWDEEAAIGFDLEHSWLKARLHVPGVKRVDIVAPTSSLVVVKGAALALGEIKINYMGRDY